MLGEFLNSKKFWAAIGGLIVTVLVVLVPSLEPLESYLTEIVGVIIAYVLGQGLADFGKHAK